MLPGPAAAREHLHLVGDAGPGRVDQLQHRDLVAQRVLLHAQDLLDRPAPHEPAFTVESLAITATGRPATVPSPVTTPSAGRSPASALASSPSSTNSSASSRAAGPTAPARTACPAPGPWCGSARPRRPWPAWPAPATPAPAAPPLVRSRPDPTGRPATPAVLAEDVLHHEPRRLGAVDAAGRGDRDRGAGPGAPIQRMRVGPVPHQLNHFSWSSVCRPRCRCSWPRAGRPPWSR